MLFDIDSVKESLKHICLHNETIIKLAKIFEKHSEFHEELVCCWKESFYQTEDADARLAHLYLFHELMSNDYPSEAIYMEDFDKIIIEIIEKWIEIDDLRNLKSGQYILMKLWWTEDVIHPSLLNKIKYVVKKYHPDLALEFIKVDYKDLPKSPVLEAALYQDMLRSMSKCPSARAKSNAKIEALLNEFQSNNILNECHIPEDYELDESEFKEKYTRLKKYLAKINNLINSLGKYCEEMSLGYDQRLKIDRYLLRFPKQLTLQFIQLSSLLSDMETRHKMTFGCHVSD